MASALPPILKPINSFIKLAKEYDKKDPVIGYFCRMYAVQKGIKLDSKSPDSKSFLFGLMDKLEGDKKRLIDYNVEAIGNDTFAQAYLENHSIEIFTSADNGDRAGVFDKSVTKGFYTASLLFEVLTYFGESNDENQIMQRYSKWKATYLHRCSQTGETPIPGPAGSGFEDQLALLVTDMSALSSIPQTSNNEDEEINLREVPSLPDVPGLPDVPSLPNVPDLPEIPSLPDIPTSNDPLPKQNTTPYNLQQYIPPVAPAVQPPPVQPAQQNLSMLTPQLDFSNLNVEQVQKHLKFAVSSLEYEDIGSAVGNLSSALELLTK